MSILKGLKHKKIRPLLSLVALGTGILVASCAPMNVPKNRTIDIPPATKATPRPETINEGREAVLTIPLGKDVLVPAQKVGETLSKDVVGPYELRGETLAGALQLVLAGYDVPIAFQSEEGLTRKITVANLKGSIDSVVKRLCGLADLYCTYEGGILEIKETETFTVSLPPLDDAGFESIATGLQAISSAETVIDDSTRTLIYTVTQRNAERAARYFDRLRANTALIVYETYIWEVQLDGGNSAGIRWENLADLGTFNTGISLDGGISNQVGTPITIGLPTKGNVNLASGDIFRFISEQGAVKTISQPQLAVLSGSEATLRVAETRNYIESLTRSTDSDGDETVSTTTAQVDSGFELTIDSSWDQSTVYASIELDIDEFIQFDDFDAGNDDTLSLPRTSERELQTQVRARPGDSILIAGLVRERDEYDESGLGFNSPSIPTGKTGITSNTELVILMRPRVIRYVTQEEFAQEKQDPILPTKREFSLSPLPKGKKEFDIDTLLNPAMAITPMEEK
jgi:hypothetical protein